MNTTDQKFFIALHKDRADTADTLQKPSARKLWRGIVDKYSDQAHFIYELIQNADDACATSARFILEPDRLIFAHNGVRHFSISDPEREEQDSEEGRLGDINAITGIAFSNKSTQENKIGKFGIGFKSVFQYTASPRIYDPEFRFRIDHYIVPSLIDEDFPDRRSEETLFVFPFDHEDRIPEETYSDIAGKLKALSYPILFLTHLLDISFQIGDGIGLYGKSVVERICYDDGIIAEKLCLSQSCENDIVSKYLWLFTGADHGLTYSVGFLIDERNHLIPVNEPAFCFFPTKETTGLRFLIHAPFLLTDSREGIRAGIAHNNTLIQRLAKLAGDALVYLRDIGAASSARIIDDSIFSIIPVDESAFISLDDVNRVSFKPFYTEIHQRFVTEQLLPCRSGYTSAQHAYWAAVPYLTELFDDTHLADLCDHPDARWVFVTLGRDEALRSNRILCDYIDSITLLSLNEQHLIRGRHLYGFPRHSDIPGITPTFIEKQDPKWLHALYKWLSETKARTEMAKTAPIFLDQDSKAAAAFDEDEEHLLLFLPSADIPNCRTVRKDLLENKETMELVEKIGITQPSIRDEIFNVILPQYESNEAIDTTPHFKLFFKYYLQCPQEEIDEFIAEIRGCEFVNYTTQDDPTLYRGMASSLYMPTNELRAYFETMPSARFITYEKYLELVGPANEKRLLSFLFELGVRRTVSVRTREIDWTERRSRQDLPVIHYGRDHEYTEQYIDGCKEIVQSIVENHDAEKSILLWNQLLNVAVSHTYGGLSYLLKGTLYYFYYTGRQEEFEASNAVLLKTAAWLMNKDGKFVVPNTLTRSTLSNRYNLHDPHASNLLDFLSIREVPGDEPDDSHLTDAQREKIELADFVLEHGFTKADLEEFAILKKAREAQPDANPAPESSVNDPAPQSRAASPVAQDILRRTSAMPATHDTRPTAPIEDIDADEFTPSPVDFSKRAELEKERAANAIDKIVHQEQLQQRALCADRYTYGWFKALLELERLNSSESNANSKEISISFSRVEREPGTQRTLILKQPNRYIPQFMEDLSDIPLLLRFGNQTKQLAIEVANVKSYTLRVKLKPHVDISEFDFSKVNEARIDAQSPAFLLEELCKQFNLLKYDDSFDMQANLSENIEFVFGPPGTGKTTHLAKDVLLPLMQRKEKYRVLVLTPTNKSADVLVRRIMDVLAQDQSYTDWLVRFGDTGDEIIEQSAVYRDKTFDIRSLARCVTVTTIARFPYDFFMPQGARVFLNGINWDYIVIDEASMIPLVNIVYPLYKKTPRKFIIAGDPFQIEPIASVDLWKDENIYTMVHLDSFVNPHTIPHDYPVKLLTTQYRSVPTVGSIFSQFAYGGILKHYRNEASRKPLNLPSLPNAAPLNIIKFPVSQYESIYRPKRLQHSSAYQVYSALFTLEFTACLAREIADTYPGIPYKIGIIAPYRAQAELIDKLVGAEKLQVDVQVDTIHGFQGDECDIILAVFNPPPNITSGKNMFLNKRNIINVAISRAKDYLFILMPDDNTEHVERLHLVKRIEHLVKASTSFAEYQAQELEFKMLGSATYLEENAFSTGHQSVNVYSLPEKQYEIRTEDTAVDVQVHRSLPSS